MSLKVIDLRIVVRSSKTISWDDAVRHEWLERQKDRQKYRFLCASDNYSEKGRRGVLWIGTMFQKGILNVG